MDPYQILGVSPQASDDEVKKAYRQQCKRWHPDLNPGDPTAEEKFKQVQAAYDQVMKMRQGGPAAGWQNRAPGSQGGAQNSWGQNGYADPFGFGGGGFRFYGPFGFGFDFGDEGWQSRQAGPAQDEPTGLQAARNYINARRYKEALNALETVSERTARWYYYHALASLGIGNTINAMESARRAAEMEPNNPEYRQLLDQLQNQGRQYRTQSSQYAAPRFGVGRLCLTYWIVQLLCSCFCGYRPYGWYFCC